jgi:hypothetical protein
MACFNCAHVATNGGPCLMDMEQRIAADSVCACFLDKDLVVNLPCKVGSTIYIHAYNRETGRYEVTPIKDIQLSELAVLIEDGTPVYLDEASAKL